MRIREVHERYAYLRFTVVYCIVFFPFSADEACSTLSDAQNVLLLLLLSPNKTLAHSFIPPRKSFPPSSRPGFPSRLRTYLLTEFPPLFIHPTPALRTSDRHLLRPCTRPDLCISLSFIQSLHPA